MIALVADSNCMAAVPTASAAIADGPTAAGWIADACTLATPMFAACTASAASSGFVIASCCTLIVATAPDPSSGFVIPAGATPKSPATTAIEAAMVAVITVEASVVPLVVPTVIGHAGVMPGTILFHEMPSSVVPATP